MKDVPVVVLRDVRASLCRLHVPSAFWGRAGFDTGAYHMFPDTGKLPKSASFLLREVKSSTALSLASTLGIGYFSASFFQRFVWGSILGNILLVPLASVSFVGGLFLWGLGSLSQSLGALFAQGVLWIPLWLMNHLAEFFSLPFFRIYLPTPPNGFLPVYLFLCGILYISLTRKTR